MADSTDYSRLVARHQVLMEMYDEATSRVVRDEAAADEARAEFAQKCAWMSECADDVRPDEEHYVNFKAEVDEAWGVYVEAALEYSRSRVVADALEPQYQKAREEIDRAKR